MGEKQQHINKHIYGIFSLKLDQYHDHVSKKVLPFSATKEFRSFYNNLNNDGNVAVMFTIYEMCSNVKNTNWEIHTRTHRRKENLVTLSSMRKKRELKRLKECLCKCVCVCEYV